MKFGKEAIISIGISSIYIIAFNVIAFVLANELDKNFWCGYIFITLAWVCMVITGGFAAGNKEKIFVHMPGLLVTGIHLLIQTILGIVVMVIPNYSIKVSIVMEIFVFAVYLIIMGMLEIYKNKGIQ